MATAPGGARALTAGEVALARSVYRDAIALDGVTIRRRRWFPFQPRQTVMAPTGHIHVHPRSTLWREDYAREAIGLRGLLIHELCHVWQHQSGIGLPLARHPFCRYHYSVVPGWPLTRYGLEQQAEIVRHVYLLREGQRVPGAPPRETLESILPW